MSGAPTPGGKPIEQELIETLRTIRCLKARSPDELEDYFHDSIIRSIVNGKAISWKYIYTAVRRKLLFGKEVRPYVQLQESIVPGVEGTGIDLKLDIKKALAVLSGRRREYILEYFYEGYTLEEMEQRHQVSNQYISKVIRQGLEDMRQVLRGKP